MIDLTERDLDRIRAVNTRNRWGISRSAMARLGREHKKASPYKKAYIEHRLTDINFHYESRLLAEGRYEEYFIAARGIVLEPVEQCGISDGRLRLGKTGPEVQSPAMLVDSDAGTVIAWGELEHVHAALLKASGKPDLASVRRSRTPLRILSLSDAFLPDGAAAYAVSRALSPDRRFVRELAARFDVHDEGEWLSAQMSNWRKEN